MSWFKERPVGHPLPRLPAKQRRNRDNHINGINVGKQNHLKSKGQGGHLHISTETNQKCNLGWRVRKSENWLGKEAVQKMLKGQCVCVWGGNRVILVECLYILTAFADILKLIINCSKTLVVTEVRLFSNLRDLVLSPSSYMSFSKSLILNFSFLVCEMREE